MAKKAVEPSNPKHFFESSDELATFISSYSLALIATLDDLRPEGQDTKEWVDKLTAESGFSLQTIVVAMVEYHELVKEGKMEEFKSDSINFDAIESVRKNILNDLKDVMKDSTADNEKRMRTLWAAYKSLYEGKTDDE